MIYESLDYHIASAMKAKAQWPTCKSPEMILNFWKAVKTEMVNAIHNGIELPDEQEELKILKSMLKQRKKAIEEFSKSDSENAKMNKWVNECEAKMLKRLLPKEPSEEDVKNETINCICSLLESGTPVKDLQRRTKDIISLVKEKYPNANNAVVAKTIKEYISDYEKQQTIN